MVESHSDASAPSLKFDFKPFPISHIPLQLRFQAVTVNDAPGFLEQCNQITLIDRALERDRKICHLGFDHAIGRPLLALIRNTNLSNELFWIFIARSRNLDGKNPALQIIRNQIIAKDPVPT